MEGINEGSLHKSHLSSINHVRYKRLVQLLSRRLRFGSWSLRDSLGLTASKVAGQTLHRPLGYMRTSWQLITAANCATTAASAAAADLL